jgi:hypothetical protein
MVQFAEPSNIWLNIFTSRFKIQLNIKLTARRFQITVYCVAASLGYSAEMLEILALYKHTPKWKKILFGNVVL